MFVEMLHSEKKNWFILVFNHCISMDRWVAVFRVLFTTLVNENFKISFQKMTWMKALWQKNLAIGRIKVFNVNPVKKWMHIISTHSCTKNDVRAFSLCCHWILFVRFGNPQIFRKQLKRYLFLTYQLRLHPHHPKDISNAVSGFSLRGSINTYSVHLFLFSSNHVSL